MTIWVNSCKLLICKIHAKWHVLHSRMVSSFLNFDNVLCNTPAPPSTPYLRSLGCCDPLTVTWISDPTVTSYNVILTGSINTVISIPSFGQKNIGEKDNSLTIIGLVSDRKAVLTISLVAINCAGSSSPLVFWNSTSKCAFIALLRCIIMSFEIMFKNTQCTVFVRTVRIF